MISRKSLGEFARKGQTTEENILREYCQHLVLSHLYRTSGSERVLFKGGTALKIIYDSPRFSEDLDFSSSGMGGKEIEEILIKILDQIEQANVNLDLKEAKVTSGGYLGKVVFEMFNSLIEIKVEVSFRDQTGLAGTPVLIKSEFFPSYILVQISEEKLVQGKVEALLTRSKPRDFYDFYFILRHPVLHRYIKRPVFQEVRDILQATPINFREELREFLPQDQQAILRDFKDSLRREIEKNL